MSAAARRRESRGPEEHGCERRGVCVGEGRGSPLAKGLQPRKKNCGDERVKGNFTFQIFSRSSDFIDAEILRGRKERKTSLAARPCSASSFRPFFSEGDRLLMAFSSRAVSAPSRGGQVRRERGGDRHVKGTRREKCPQKKKTSPTLGSRSPVDASFPLANPGPTFPLNCAR